MTLGRALSSSAVRLTACLILLTLLGAVDARGEDNTAPLSLGALGITGTATAKNYTYFHDHGSQTFVDQGILELGWSRRSPWGSLTLVGDVRADDDDFTDGVTFQVQEKDKRRSIVNLREAVLLLKGGPVDVMLGKQFFAWGTADAHNPTDLINPRDYMDVVDNEKMGVYSAAARVTARASSLLFVVIPAFAPSRLPLATSRWFPEPPAGFVAVADDREIPPVSIDNMQYAARAHTTFKGVDVSLAYYDGFEHLPVARQSSVAVAPGVVVPRFTPVFARIKSPGFDVSTTYRKFEFHGEGAFRLVESNGREDRFHWIVGTTYTWDELPVRWIDHIIVTVEYAREDVLASRANSPIIELGTAPEIGDVLSTRAFRNAAVTRILLKFSEETQLKLSTTVDFTTSANSYVQPKLTHKITDALHAEAAVDIFTGARNSFWGRWRDNTRLFLSMKYFF